MFHYLSIIYFIIELIEFIIINVGVIVAISIMKVKKYNRFLWCYYLLVIS